jgi:hypothetical protein
MKSSQQDTTVSLFSSMATKTDGSYSPDIIDNRKLGKSLDDTAKGSTASRDSETSAFHMFRNMDRKGSAKAANEDTTLPTVHQNTIT